MKKNEFHIGLEFMSGPGFWFRCTDVGQRTVVAIRLDRGDPSWYAGPPYAVQEIVFDEYDLEDCYLTEEQAIEKAVIEAETSAHPGFPHEHVSRMMEARWENPDHGAYPSEGLLRFDRVHPDGEIFHPYSARKVGEGWVILCYVLFTCQYEEVAESTFIGWPIAGEVDLKKRKELNEGK